MDDGLQPGPGSVALRKSSPPQFLSIFLSSGKADTIATPAQVENVKESMRRTGFRKLRLETHDGAHVIYQPHIVEALRWFAAVGSTPSGPPQPLSSFEKLFKKP
ncbi:MAG: hypothetical protein ABI787_12875 [Spartobacteria bacterium]